MLHMLKHSGRKSEELNSNNKKLHIVCFFFLFVDKRQDSVREREKNYG